MIKFIVVFVWFLLAIKANELPDENTRFCGFTYVREALQNCEKAKESLRENDQIINVGNLCQVKRQQRSCCNGWTGSNCIFPICLQPCKNGGQCVAPEKCLCSSEFTGKDCSEKIAEELPCREACIKGKCNKGVCKCDEGYIGETCDQAYCEKGCGTGKCVEPDVCKCPQNYKGTNCEVFFRPQQLDNSEIIDIINSHYSNYQICSVMGGNHLRTFDGVPIDDSLRGSNILVMDCLNRQPNYRIFLNSSHLCHSQNFANCDTSLTIQVDSDTFKFSGLEKPFSTTKDNYAGSIQYKVIGHYLQIKGISEIEILYDGYRNVFIFAPQTLKKSVCGMCGYFDGDPSKNFEFKNINGEIIESTKEFVKYWKNPDPTDVNDYSVPVEDACHKLKPNMVTWSNNMCQDVFRGELSLCNDFSSIPYFDICRNETCKCLKSSHDIKKCSKIACTLGSFKSYRCTMVGKLVNWRKHTCAPVVCPANKEYMECGNSCSQNCEDLVNDDGCKLFCTPGCFCPKDRFWNGTYCVPRPQCPCLRKNVNGMVVYQQGMSFKRDCEICECSKGGIFACKRIRGCSGTCVVSGDPHYTTFDRRHIYVEGNCLYTMVNTLPSVTGDQVLKIWVKNTHCMKSNDAFCTKSMSIQFGDGDNKSFIQLLSTKNILINGIVNKPPLSIQYPMPIVIQEVAFETLLIESYTGVRVLWLNKTQIEITLPEFYQDKVQGLCGNYNGNSEDDNRKSSGQLTTNDNELAVSWSTTDCQNTLSLNYLGVCAKSHEYEKFAASFCRQLLHDPFSSCHLSVDPNPYIKQCEHDICLCGGNAKDNCGCDSMASYSRACMRNGIQVQWRKHNLCDPKCPVDMEYKQCKNRCSVSCFSLTQTNCSTECVDGCQCKEDMVFDAESNKCVNISQCQCQFENLNYVAGSKRKDKCNECVCSNGLWICTKNDCTNKTFCPPGMIWKQCGHCDQTCENQDGFCSEKSCKSGCFCPDGYLLSNKTCVPKHQCPCLWSGHSYTNKSVINTGPTNCLSKCTCNEGKWECQQEKKCVGSCKSWGDAHYKTFDGKYFDFVSKCSYTMVDHDCGSGAGTFHLEIENIECGNHGSSCTKAIIFYYKNLIVRLLRGTNPTVVKNDKYHSNGKEGKVSFRDLVSQIIIYTDNNIVLYWDKGLSIEIVLPPEYQNKVCGLCGNFDQNINNDLKSKAGNYENNILAFVDSWKARANCPASKDVPDMCKSNPEREVWADKMCILIKDKKFAECHKQVDSELYYQKCLSDTCSCNKGGDCECMCSALSAFYSACKQFGIDYKWRTNDLCPVMCPPNKTFVTCIDNCPRKCFKPYVINTVHENCKNNCVEGCSCEAGQIEQEGTNKCIKENECFCKLPDSDKNYLPGEKVYQNCLICECLQSENRFVCKPDPKCITSTISFCTDKSLILCEKNICARRCNGIPECTDGKDEINCTSLVSHTSQMTTPMPGCYYKGKILKIDEVIETALCERIVCKRNDSVEITRFCLTTCPELSVLKFYPDKCCDCQPITSTTWTVTHETTIFERCISKQVKWTPGKDSEALIIDVKNGYKVDIENILKNNSFPWKVNAESASFSLRLHPQRNRDITIIGFQITISKEFELQITFGNHEDNIILHPRIVRGKGEIVEKFATLEKDGEQFQYIRLQIKSLSNKRFEIKNFVVWTCDKPVTTTYTTTSITPTTTPEVCTKEVVTLKETDRMKVDIRNAEKIFEKDIKNIFTSEREVRVISPKFSFVIELTPKSNTEVTIVNLEIHVNTRSRLTVSFGHEINKLNKQTYTKEGTGSIDIYFNKNDKNGEPFRFVQVEIKTLDRTSPVVKNLVIKVCYESLTTRTSVVTSACTETSTPILNQCFTKSCINGSWVIRKVCLLSCPKETHRLVENEDQCCECLPINTIQSTTTNIVTTTTPFCKPPLIHTFCKKSLCESMCQAQQIDNCSSPITSVCQSGCECPENLFFDGKECVPRKECLCIDENGSMRKNGEEWTIDCKTYVCDGKLIKQIFKDCKVIPENCPMENRVMIDCCLVCNITTSTTSMPGCVYLDQTLKFGETIVNKTGLCEEETCLCNSNGHLVCTKNQDKLINCQETCSKSKCEGQLVVKEGKCVCSCSCLPSTIIPPTPCSTYSYKCNLPCDIGDIEELNPTHFQKHCDLTKAICGECSSKEYRYIDKKTNIQYCLSSCCTFKGKQVKVGETVPNIDDFGNEISCSSCECQPNGRFKCLTDSSCISTTTIISTSKASICEKSCKEIVEEPILSPCRKRVCNKLNERCLRNNLCDGLICECREPLVYNGTDCINIKECPCLDKITKREFRVGEIWIDATDECKIHLCKGNEIETKDKRKECPILECESGCIKTIIEEKNKCCPLCSCNNATTSTIYTITSQTTQSITQTYTTTKLPLCTYIFCSQYTCDGRCVNHEARLEECDQLICSNRLTQVFMNSTVIMCARIIEDNCFSTTALVSPSTSKIPETSTHVVSTTRETPGMTTSTETQNTSTTIETPGTITYIPTTSMPTIGTTTTIPLIETSTPSPTTQSTNTQTQFVTTSAPCVFVDGLKSHLYIADHQVSINGKSIDISSKLRISDPEGLEVSISTPPVISIDFTDKGNREIPFIYQIIIGKNVENVQITNVYKNGSRSEFVRTFTKSPAIVEINEYLSTLDIKITSTLNKKEKTMINLEIIGCFEKVEGCLLEGKQYLNHQTINSTSSADKCTSQVCYCKDHRAFCRTKIQSNNCSKDEIKTCSVITSDVTCCTCMPNVTEAYCTIDYLCNPHCGICLDESDTWGKETKIKNSTQCVCKEGYQSLIESTEEKKGALTKVQINAKCMSLTVDERACGTRKPTTSIGSTTTKIIETPETTTQTTTLGTTTSETLGTTTSATSIGTTITTEAPGTTTVTTVVGTPTTIETPGTISTINTIETTTTSEIPGSTATTSQLPTTTLTSQFTRQTTFKPPVTTPKSTTSQSPTTITRPLPITTTLTESSSSIVTETTSSLPPRCYYKFCSEFTCDEKCLIGEERREDCDQLVCSKGLIEIFKNDTYIVCTKRKEENCATKTSYSTTTQSTLTTTTTETLGTTTTPTGTPTTSITEVAGTTTSTTVTETPGTMTPTTTRGTTTTETTGTQTTLVGTSTTIETPGTITYIPTTSMPTIGTTTTIPLIETSTPSPTTQSTNTQTQFVTTSAPCVFVDGLKSHLYIADHQVSINGKSIDISSKLRISDPEGLEVSISTPPVISIDFTDKGNREIPFIYQIIIGKNVENVQITNVYKNGSRSEFVRTFTKSPAIVEINEYLSTLDIKITSTLNKKEKTMINLEIIGCFEKVEGCLLEGKQYLNHQTINSTSSADKCTSQVCYCKDHRAFCRTKIQSNNCSKDEIKTCSVITSDVTCCTCMPNVTEAYCTIDYLCNPHCGICLDESDTWGKETKIKNSTQCVCKEGYQSLIESTEEKKGALTKVQINAKCMSLTVDERACGTRKPTTSIGSTTTKIIETPETTTQTTTLGTTTSETLGTTTSATSIGTTITTEAPGTTTVTTVVGTPTTIETPGTISTINTIETTTTSEIPGSTATTSQLPTTTLTSQFTRQTTFKPPVTTPKSTTSQSPTTITRPLPITTTLTESSSSIVTETTSSLPPRCYYKFCSEFTCDEKCLIGEERREDCDQLVCSKGLIEIFKNDTYIVCTKRKEENCATTTSQSMTSLPTTESISVSETTGFFTTTEEPRTPTTTEESKISTTTEVPRTTKEEPGTFTTMIGTLTTSVVTSEMTTPVTPSLTTISLVCTYMFCSEYTCDGKCVNSESRLEDCSLLGCSRRLKQVFKNSTFIVCARVKQENCGSTISSTLTETTLTTTPEKQCFAVICSLFTCDKVCLTPYTETQVCSSLNCSRGYKEVYRNETYVYCTESIMINCGSISNVVTTTSTLPPLTTTAPSECNPIMSLSNEKYVASVRKSTNLGGEEIESWISSPLDTNPQLEISFKNTLTLITIELSEMKNVQKMNVLISEDGKTYKTVKRFTGRYQVTDVFQNFLFEQTSVLSLKLVVIQKYDDSQYISMRLKVLGCGKVCPPPMIHVNCSCQQTCDSLSDPKSQLTCTSCTAGCQCPEGMVNNNGKCIKITECPCFYNGRSYAFGDKIPTSDPCKFMICTKESLQEITEGNCTKTCKETMEPCACDGCHRTCNKNNMESNCDLNSCKSGCCCPKGTIYSEILDKCVKHCPCIYNNKTYEVGETWKNRCLDCRCDMVKGAYCVENGCDFDECPPRHKLVNENPVDNVCCKCVPIDPVCTFNQKEYNVGEIWNDGPCRTFKCIMEEGKPMVITSRTECPAIDCPSTHSLIKFPNECCERCVPNNVTTTTSPKPTTTSPTQNCQRISNEKIIKMNDCISMNAVDIGSCQGACRSSSSISYENGIMDILKNCKCCFPTITEIQVQYICPGNVSKTLPSQVITGCNCNSCG